MNFNINPRTVSRNLIVFISFLFLGNLVSVFLKHSINSSQFNHIIYFFDFDYERNLPTFYSSLALLFSGILLMIIALESKNNKKAYFHWMGLAFLFFFLSLDEIVSIHEHLAGPTRELLNTSGFLYNAWIIPYFIMATVIFVIYLKFLLRLPRKILYLFLLSGLIFVTGAVGFESMIGYQDESIGEKHISYYILYTLEELFEMLGVVLFIYSLLLYISDEIKSVHFKNRNINS